MQAAPAPSDARTFDRRSARKKKGAEPAARGVSESRGEEAFFTFQRDHGPPRSAVGSIKRNALGSLTKQPNNDHAQRNTTTSVLSTLGVVRISRWIQDGRRLPRASSCRSFRLRQRRPWAPWSRNSRTYREQHSTNPAERLPPSLTVRMGSAAVEDGAGRFFPLPPLPPSPPSVVPGAGPSAAEIRRNDNDVSLLRPIVVGAAGVGPPPHTPVSNEKLFSSNIRHRRLSSVVL